MNAKWLLILVVLIAFTGAVLMFGRSDSTQIADWQAQVRGQSQRKPRQYLVVYARGVFSPTNLRIRIQDSVLFRNESAETIRLSQFASGDIEPKSSFLYTFLSEGTYMYTNAVHQDEHGTITVRP